MAWQRCEASQPFEPGHGAIAEFWPLRRDGFVFEDGQRLVLFWGLPDRWLEQPEEIIIDGLQTYFGISSLTYKGRPQGGASRFSGAASPQGFILGWPKGPKGNPDGRRKVHRIGMRVETSVFQRRRARLCLIFAPTPAHWKTVLRTHRAI
jgi:hypothetical protein